MRILLVNWDNPSVRHVVEKLATENVQEGSIVRLTEDEIKAVLDAHQFMVVDLPESKVIPTIMPKGGTTSAS